MPLPTRGLHPDRSNDDSCGPKRAAALIPKRAGRTIESKNHNIQSGNSMKSIPLVLMLTLPVLTACSSGDDASRSDGYEAAVKDARMAGNIDTVFALNSNLDAFVIDTAVENGIVHLTGTVESDLDRDLAGELAKGVTGVVDVQNNLTIEKTARQMAAERTGADGKRTFGGWVDDATTTAAVKAKLVGNSNTTGLQIDVDTMNDLVTLSGEVSSAEMSQLAEEIARNTGDVKDVRNQLVVAVR
jgi:osmotically-inducible protein OsmY